MLVGAVGLEPTNPRILSPHAVPFATRTRSRKARRFRCDGPRGTLPVTTSFPSLSFHATQESAGTHSSSGHNHSPFLVTALWCNNQICSCTILEPPYVFIWFQYIENDFVVCPMCCYAKSAV